MNILKQLPGKQLYVSEKIENNPQNYEGEAVCLDRWFSSKMKLLELYSILGSIQAVQYLLPLQKIDK